MDRLRKVKLDAPGGNYILETWDGGPPSPFGKRYIGFRFYNPQGTVIFGTPEGSAPLKLSPLHSIDSDESLRALLGFLTVKPGDTDREYFDNYTEEQMAFARSYDCEYLGLYAYEDDGPESYTAMAFEDVE